MRLRPAVAGLLRKLSRAGDRDKQSIGSPLATAITGRGLKRFGIALKRWVLMIWFYAS